MTPSIGRGLLVNCSRYMLKYYWRWVVVWWQSAVLLQDGGGVMIIWWGDWKGQWQDKLGWLGWLGWWDRIFRSSQSSSVICIVGELHKFEQRHFELWIVKMWVQKPTTCRENMKWQSRKDKGKIGACPLHMHLMSPNHRQTTDRKNENSQIS